MFKKYMKKVLAFTLAGALAFSGAQIAGVGGTTVASAAATALTLIKGGAAKELTVTGANPGVATTSLDAGEAITSTLKDSANADASSKFTITGLEANAPADGNDMDPKPTIKATTAGAGTYTLTLSTPTGGSQVWNITVKDKTVVTFDTKEVWINAGDNFNGHQVKISGVEDAAAVTAAELTVGDATKLDGTALATGVTAPTCAIADDVLTTPANKVDFTIDASAATKGDYLVPINTSGVKADAITIHVIDVLEATTTATSVLPGSSFTITAKNVGTGALSIDAIGAKNGENGIKEAGKETNTSKFTYSVVGSGTTKTITITPIVGKVEPESNTFTVKVKGTETTGISKSTTAAVAVGAYQFGSSTTLTLAPGEAGKVWFAQGDAADPSGYKIDGLDNNVAPKADVTATQDGTAVLFAITATNGVDGKSCTYKIIGNSNAKTYGTVSVTIKSKARIEGAVASATVAVDSTTNLVALNAAKTAIDDTKVTVYTEAGVATAGSGVNHWSVSYDQADFAVDTGNTKTLTEIKGKTAGSVTATLSAWGNADENAAGALLATKKIPVTVVPKPSITVTDAKGNVLGGNTTLSLDKLKNTTATVTVTKPEGTTLTMTSGDTTKATVTNEGVITVVGTGTVTITASTAATSVYPALSASFDVVITEKPLNPLTVKDENGLELTDMWDTTVNPAAYKGYVPKTDKIVKLDLLKRKEAQLTTTSLSSGQIEYRVSQGSNFFSVDKYTGKITTKANTTGQGYITVTVNGTPDYEPGIFRVYVTVTEKPEDNITVGATDLTVVVGKSLDLGAKSEAGATLTYKAADVTKDLPGKVSVDGAGKITGVTAGKTEVTIRAAATDNTIVTEKTVGITVKAFEDNTIVVKDETGATVGDSVEIKAASNWTISAEGKATISAKSLNADVVSISQANGIFTLTPNKAGAAIIQIDAKDATKYADTTRYIVVNYGKTLTTITADKSVSVTVGKTAQISASAADGSALSYTSNDASIATVSDTGLVTGVKGGATVVIVSAPDGAVAAVSVTVKKAANTLTVKGKTATVKAGKKVTLKKAKVLSISKAKGSVTVTKKSGSAKIKVAKSGKVTVKKGLKAGTYKVKVAVKAAGNASYKAKTVNVTIKIKVK